MKEPTSYHIVDVAAASFGAAEPCSVVVAVVVVVVLVEEAVGESERSEYFHSLHPSLFSSLGIYFVDSCFQVHLWLLPRP